MKLTRKEMSLFSKIEKLSIHGVYNVRDEHPDKIRDFEKVLKSLETKKLIKYSYRQVGWISFNSLSNILKINNL